MHTVGAYEAKTRLSELLDLVQDGGQVTITRHGVPVALMVSPGGHSKRAAAETIAELREFRKTLRLRGLSIRKMIEEGRR
jgi:prevent-host-death family protein